MSEFMMGIVATTGETDVFGLVVSGSMFVVSVLATLAFGYALIADRAWLTQAWARIRRLPLVVQGVLWLVFLPWMAALWAWRHAPSVWVGLPVVIALVCWADFMLLPWKG